MKSVPFRKMFVNDVEEFLYDICFDVQTVPWIEPNHVSGSLSAGFWTDLIECYFVLVATCTQSVVVESGGTIKYVFI